MGTFLPAFTVSQPTSRRIPVVFSSPHSGTQYPADFLAASRLNRTTIRRSEDSFVDELFEVAAARGAPLLRAHFPRAWLDVNREPYELDPAMFSDQLPPYANVRSSRVAGGLGTIARVVGDHEEIYAAPLSVDEALARISTVYMPYHAALRALVAETHTRFGVTILVDCHSMPSSPRGTSRPRPDFVVGDRHGTSCGKELTDAACTFLGARGFSVGRNKPYAGGFITEHYGRPGQSLHALQIEVNRGLYMDERNFTKSEGFDAIASLLAELTDALTSAEQTFAPTRAAAE
ncbi:MAG: N-formylglutamate amidohydrolase [Bauldia sp.]